MITDGKVKRSGVPRDLRTAAPPGDVVKYWELEAFTWYGEDSRRSGGKDEAFIRLQQNRIRVSHAAAVMAGIERGDRVKVGVNGAFMAIRKDSEGIPTKGDHPSTKAVYIPLGRLGKELQAAGWPVPVRLFCNWDERNGMLVVKKPSY